MFAPGFSCPRPDHMVNMPYMRQHWKFHLFQWVLFVAAILGPQFLGPLFEQKFLGPLFDHSSLLIPVIITTLCFNHLWYFLLCWQIIGHPHKWRSLFSSVPAALQTWELLLWCGWLLQGLSVSLITALPYDLEPLYLDISQEKLNNFWDFALWVSIVVYFCAFAVKAYIPCISGMNNYYYYDTVLSTPNERFVNSGLYSIFSSPTYSIGYVRANFKST